MRKAKIPRGLLERLYFDFKKLNKSSSDEEEVNRDEEIIYSLDIGDASIIYGNNIGSRKRG